MKFQALILSSLVGVSFCFHSPAANPLCMRSTDSTSDIIDDGTHASFVDGAKQCLAAASLSAALAFGTLTSLPSPSAADASSPSAIDPTRTIQVEVDAPTLIKRLKSPTYQKELLDALSEVQDVVGKDSLKITPPSNKVGAIRDLLSGKVDVSLNGQALDIEVLESEKGEITVRFSNPLLPKVPVISSKAKIPFLPEVEGQGTVQIVEKEVTAAKPDLSTILDAAWLVFGPEDSAHVDLVGLLARAYGIDLSTPIQDQPFLGGLLSIPIPRADDKGGAFTYTVSNKDFVGGGSLGLGLIYAVSYSYHTALIEQEERGAEEKKKEQAEMKKKAAAAKKKKEDKIVAVTPKTATTPVKGETSNESKPKAEKKVAELPKEKSAAKKAKEPAVKKESKKEEPAAASSSSAEEDEGEPKKKSRLRRLFSRKNE